LAKLQQVNVRTTEGWKSAEDKGLSQMISFRIVHKGHRRCARESPAPDTKLVSKLYGALLTFPTCMQLRGNWTESD
jgi:hypothetical protein